MARREERQSWEYADGPVVGRDVPITSEPREEVKPGVPRDPQPEAKRGEHAGADGAEGVEEREVRAADPDISSESNQRLTAELREVVGAERVRVPADRPRKSRGESMQPAGPLGFLSMHRFQVIRSLAIVLTFAAVVALATGSWWVLPAAAGVHAIGTMTVALTAIRMTTTIERPSAQLAAALTEEGVRSPDEYFSDLVEEFRPESGGGAGEVLGPGDNERSVPAGSDNAEAGAEQSSAMTPTSQPSEPTGDSEGVGSKAMRRPGSLVAIIICTGLAVAAFCAVIALVFQH